MSTKEAENLGNSWNNDLVVQPPPDRERHDSGRTSVMGQDPALLDQNVACLIKPNHIQSQENFPLLLVPNKSTGHTEDKDPSVCNKILLNKASTRRLPPKPLHEEPQGLQPHKIILQGDSSKNNSAAVKVSSCATDSAPIKRRILSRNEANSNVVAAKNKGKNQGVTISETAPISQDFKKAHNLEMVFQAQRKSQIGGPLTSGPNSRKFKWTRPPTNNA